MKCEIYGIKVKTLIIEFQDYEQAVVSLGTGSTGSTVHTAITTRFYNCVSTAIYTLWKLFKAV